MYTSLQELQEIPSSYPFWRQPFLHETVIPKRIVEFRNKMYSIPIVYQSLTEPEFNPVFQFPCDTIIPKISHAVYPSLLLFR